MRVCVHMCARMCVRMCARVCVCENVWARVCATEEKKQKRKQLFAKYTTFMNPFISQMPARVQSAVCGRSVRCTYNVKLRRVRITIITIHQQHCVHFVLLLPYMQLLTI